MVGVGIQQGFILLFLSCAIGFHRKLLSQHKQTGEYPSQAFTLLYVIYAVLVLITTRIIFRLCEYAQGLDSTIPNHEVYQFILDSSPMLIASLLLNVWHLGRIMRGKAGDILSRTERKAGVVSKRWTAGRGQTTGEELSNMV